MARTASRTYPVHVRAVQRMSPHFVRVVVGSDELADIGVGGPDQRIKVLFPRPGSGVAAIPAGDDWYALWRAMPETERSPMRTYTIRSADAERGEVVIDFVAHGDSGPASRWIAQARVGEKLLIVAPDRTVGVEIGVYEWHPGAATEVLIAGDETAVPAICAILESLSAGARGAVFREVQTSADILPATAPAGVTVTWLPRDGDARNRFGVLLDAAVRAWIADWSTGDASSDGSAAPPNHALPEPGTDMVWEVPDEPTGSGLYAWLAGEAGTITGLRRHLVRDVGIDRSRITFLGYWKLGRAEN